MKELSVEDQIYLCKYHDVDTRLKTTTKLNPKEVEEVIAELKEKGVYKQYRKMSDEEYEKIIEDEKKKKSKYKSTIVQNSKVKDIKEETTQISDLENTFVKVSVKTIMDWSYQKGYLDRMLEEEDNGNDRWNKTRIVRVRF